MHNLIRPNPGGDALVAVTPQSAGWRYLSFSAHALEPGAQADYPTGANEMALVPLSGQAAVTVSSHTFALARESVFAGRPQVVYAPPGHTLRVAASTHFEFALGGAPAEGRYPVRLFEPHEMREEIRGGGTAVRQVNHILAAPLPAERLILFEVYVPGGQWSSWPPHCHDGYGGSPYLEEIYYYLFSPSHSFGFHRNYRRDEAFDEVFVVRHGDLILVPKGFHPNAAPPGSNMYFLNYLAGDLLDEARAAPPVDDPDLAWMRQDWGGKPMSLPIGAASDPK
jgi:5-deoxy-glucuronate isomerase